MLVSSSLPFQFGIRDGFVFRVLRHRHTNTHKQNLSAAFQLVDGDLTDLLVGVGAVKRTRGLVALLQVQERLLRRCSLFVTQFDTQR